MYTQGSRYTVDYAWMAQEFTRLMDEHVSINYELPLVADYDHKLIDKELLGWILPQFSTTTPVDTTVYAIQMMSTLQKYAGFQ